MRNIGGSEKILWQSKRGSRSGSIGCGLGEGLRACQPSSGLGLRDTLQFPTKILRVLCGYFEHQRRVQFEGCAAEPLRTTTAVLPGSKSSCLLLRIVLQDALSEVMKIYPPLKLRVFVDITAVVKGSIEKWRK